jgi:fructokinase
MLPSGRQLGGAPANFAYISTLLGNEGIVASRVGNDALGTEALKQLTGLNVGVDFIQTDAVHRTGVVNVELDHTGQPKFDIATGVAWDFLEWTSDWQKLATQVDAICFGSLAQRAETSHATIVSFLKAARKDTTRIFDVNLRQEFYSKEVLSESIRMADIVKLNHEELPKVMRLLGLDHRDEITSTNSLLKLHRLKMICVTRGCRGSLLVAEQGLHEHAGYRVHVADTVGAGDAFTAGLVSEYLLGSSLAEINETANRVGAWVASQVGAMPVPAQGIDRALASIAC